MENKKIKVICFDKAKKTRYFDNELKAQQYFDLLTLKYNLNCKIEVNKIQPCCFEQIKIEF